MTSRSPLHEHHQRLGARFVDFGGWEMPVQYESVLAEHRSVRTTAGVFDVSHLGRLAVSGSGTTEALARLLCNDVRAYEPGRTHYTMLLTERGGIIDDLVIWRWDEEDYWLMPNAANSDVVADAIRAVAADVSVQDLRPVTAMMAVQGPDAPAILTETLDTAPRRFRTERSGDVRLAGTGYTGETGGELCCPSEAAGEVFDRLVEAGAVPCGLGSRDTLRLEAGLPLWGSDIDHTTTPLEAGLDFAVKWEHEFIGRQALVSQRERGVGRRLAGLVMKGRGIPRHGYPVRSDDATGSVTSGNISPVLDTGIALAYLSPPVPPQSEVEVEVRGRWVPATVVEPPFHR